MQKALVIQCRSKNDYGSSPISCEELNKHLSEGWNFVSASPFGVGVSEGGETNCGSAIAALLVVIEKE